MIPGWGHPEVEGRWGGGTGGMYLVETAEDVTERRSPLKPGGTILRDPDSTLSVDDAERIVTACRALPGIHRAKEGTISVTPRRIGRTR